MMYKSFDVALLQAAFFSGDRERSRPKVDFWVGGEDGFDGGDAGPSAPSRAARALR